MHPWNYSLFLLLLVLCNGRYGSDAQHSPELSAKSLNHVGEKLNKELYRIAKAASAHDRLVQGFQDLGMTLKHMNPMKAIEEIAKNVSAMLEKKVAAVKRLVESAENMTMVNVSLPIENITYYNAKEMDDEKNSTDEVFMKMEFIRDARFPKEPVNLTYSTVHVPTNIYNKARVVLQGIEQTTNLDAVFRQNLQEDPTLKTQYFGSAEGFLRLFPGIKWVNAEANRPDMYDCRLYNWYIRASSSPKDVIILVDISGSMTGIREEIARTTAKVILNILHEDDFFNIIMLKEKPEFLDPCSHGKLVQASEMTKNRYIAKLATMDTVNIANYSGALNLAFDTLQSPNNSYASNCNKAIMIITDGAPDKFEELFDERNQNKSVRVFTYVIGREVTVFEELRNMACSNRGFVTHISTVAEVRDHVETCVSVFARPLGMSSLGSKATWAWHESRPQGMETPSKRKKNPPGMAITVSQPVFDRSPWAKKGHLVGVVAVDVPVHDIKAMMQEYKWGAGSYIFAANHNGHILFHPFWRVAVKESGRPTQSYNEVDLNEVEFPLGDDTENGTEAGDFNFKLRSSMIDKETGMEEMKILRQLNKEKRVYRQQYQYFYAGVKESQISIGLAIPTDLYRRGSYLLEPVGFLDEQQFDARDILSNNSTHLGLHPAWEYCNMTLPVTKEKLFYHLYPDLKPADEPAPNEEESEEEEGEETLTVVKCDTQLVQSLLFDLKATQPAVDSWRSLSFIHHKHSIEAVFVITRAGATRFYDIPTTPMGIFADDFDENAIVRTIRSRVRRDDEEQDTTTEETLMAVDRDIGDGPAQGETRSYAAAAVDFGNSTEPGHYLAGYNRAVEEAFYERTVMTEHSMTATISLSRSADRRELSIVMLSMPLYVGSEDDLGIAPVGISGVFMKVDQLRDLLVQFSIESCNGSADCLACHMSSVSCFILDEDGYVIAHSKSNEFQAKFFGVLHGEVMRALVKKQAFNRFSLVDYQGTCLRTPTTNRNAGFSFRPWLQSLWKGIHLLSTHSFGIIWSLLPKAVRGQETTTVAPSTGAAANVTVKKVTPKAPTPAIPCEMKYDLYHSPWSSTWSDTIKLNCLARNCTKTVVVSKSELSNMLLVAMDKADSCPCTDNPISLDKVIKKAPNGCEKWTTVPYRSPPADCFSYDPNEDSTACRANSRCQTSAILQLFLAVLCFKYFKFAQ